MDTRELDRLINLTEMTPVNKTVLRQLRKSVMSGRVDGPFLSKYHWTVTVVGAGAFQRVTFALRRVKDTDGSTS